MAEEQVKAPSDPFAHLPESQRKILESLKVTRSPQYRTISSNVMRTRISAGDITLIFSRLTHSPSLSANADIVEEEVEIVMSWAQLKVCQLTLQSIVEAIEMVTGEVKLPQGVNITKEAQLASLRVVFGNPKS